MINKNAPVIHCIANIVTVNDCANILYAVGASPVMAHHPLEVSEITEKSNALVCSMGAMESLDAMMTAGIRSFHTGHPVIIDPVGAGASEYRRRKCLEMIKTVHPLCIRGNASEIKALIYEEASGRGVDASCADTVSEKKLMEYSEKNNVIIIVTGTEDFICDGKHVIKVGGGSRMFGKITGAGCMLSAVLGAFFSVEKSIEAASAACEMFKIAGEKAEKSMHECGGGSMTFRQKFTDVISIISSKV